MAEDPRMGWTIPRAAPDLPHDYMVAARRTVADPWRVFFINGNRHRALQVYIAARVALHDFDQEPDKFLVRISCDGVEYFNNQDRSLRGHLTGSSRPLPADRRMP